MDKSCSAICPSHDSVRFDARGAFKGKLLILAMFMLAVAGTIAYNLLNGAADVTAGDISVAAVDGGGRAEFKGITLQLHNSNCNDEYKKLIDEIAATGANTIALSVAGYQENCSSTSIFIDQRRSPSKEEMAELIQYAHSKGLMVTLMPIVLLENGRSSEWRGKIEPEGKNWDDWWEDYTNFLMHYVYIAQANKVEIFMVGSELISTENQAHTKRWRQLIKLVRKNYKGRLSYSSNWDHYHVPQFWNDLDIIGMTTYYELAKEKETPTEKSLAAKWKGIRKDILTWRAKSKLDKPLLFTEVGWPNQITAAYVPWDYYRSEGKPDPKLQALCFKTFFDTWKNDKAVAGFLVWEWRDSTRKDTSANKDTSYVPRDKPAMEIITKFFTQAPKEPELASQPTSAAVSKK